MIAFAYSGFQSYDLAYQLTARVRKPRQNLRYYLDFSLDQVSLCLDYDVFVFIINFSYLTTSHVLS